MANKPEKAFRIGSVSASVFACKVDQDGSSRTLRSVSLQKRYKDGDEVKYTTSFDLSELPQIIRVTQLAKATSKAKRQKCNYPVDRPPMISHKRSSSAFLQPESAP